MQYWHQRTQPGAGGLLGLRCGLTTRCSVDRNLPLDHSWNMSPRFTTKQSRRMGTSSHLPAQVQWAVLGPTK
jgi:hypothetical protein